MALRGDITRVGPVLGGAPAATGAVIEEFDYQVVGEQDQFASRLREGRQN
jgi:hypothetical protein